MAVSQRWQGALLCAAIMALAVPAAAQIADPVGCYCLQQEMNAATADMNARSQELEAARAALAQLDAQLAAARAQVDVNNQQSVDAFRRLLERRDAAFQNATGGLIAASQAATGRYNAVVADYNNRCAGRPLPPPPPGLSCPAMR